MTASRAGLAALTAIALVLALVVVLEAPRGAPGGSRRLLPGFAPDRIVALTIAHPDGAVELARDDTGWRVTRPAPGPADEAVVADVLGALELASAERWGDRGVGLDAPRVTVTAVDDRGDARRLAIGDDGAGGLVWAAVPGAARAALVDGWIARALDRRAADLRARVVVPVAVPTAIEVHAGGVDLVASGAPLRAHLAGGIVRIAPPRADALVDAVRGLRFTSLPTAPPPERLGTVRVLGGAAPVELDDLGACPGAPADRWLGGSAGSGCVAAAAWHALLDAARAIAAGGADVVDPHPLGPGPVTRVTLADGATLERRGGDWSLDGAPADDGAVSALLADLAAAATVTPGAVPASSRAVTVLHASGATDELLLDPARPRVSRRGEPWSLTLPADLATRLRAGAAAVTDRTLLAADPYLLRSITIGEAGRSRTLTLGPTLDAWLLDDRPVADPAAVLALRDLTAALTGAPDTGGTAGVPDTGGTAGPAPKRVIRLGFAAPPVAGGEASEVVLEVGAPRRGGRCRVAVRGATRVGDPRGATRVGTVGAEDCRVLLAPLE